MSNRPEEKVMSPQMTIGETTLSNPPEENEMSPQTNPHSKGEDVKSLKDGLCKNQCKLTKKSWLILIGIILVAGGVVCVIVYYPREPAENSVQQQYENQKKILQGIGCSPKPVVMNVLSLLTKEDDMLDYEIEEWLLPIFQCNDISSICGVNGNCTCVPTENGQTNATTIIKRRNWRINNAEWEYKPRTLNIINHTECVGKAV